MWRYFAITDRRLRARTWSRLDLAASNALMWTGNGWDGTEQMVTRSLPYCTYLPSHARAELVSEETAKTIVVAIQGTQAIYLVISSFARLGIHDFSYLGADQIFYPLAILGLLRLCAAPWLSRDFRYTSRTNDDKELAPKASEAYGQEDETRLSLDSLIHLPDTAPMTRPRYCQVSCWQGRLLRTFYLVLLTGIWSFTLIWIFPIAYRGGGEWGGGGHRLYTTTSFVTALFYFIMMTISVTVHAYYFIRGQTTSTIIPCTGYLWYKIYTVILFAMMTALWILSLVETTRTVCGTYTSYPATLADMTCSMGDMRVWQSDPNSHTLGVIGLALKYPRVVKGTVLQEGEFWVMNFTGTCLGHRSSNLLAHAMPLDLVDLEGISTIFGLDDLFTLPSVSANPRPEAEFPRGIENCTHPDFQSRNERFQYADTMFVRLVVKAHVV
ncbi:hypothetical protein HD806DRAFT_545610 [Xylariaceae sp. AK1471]|nr:hypothetical protein HD806DRAFT_545610 [Xylariaceae sp. AK1471]